MNEAEMAVDCTGINDTDYRTFVQAACDGRILVGVDRVFARRLYTGVPISVIRTATGEPPYIEKLVVWFGVKEVKQDL